MARIVEMLAPGFLHHITRRGSRRPARGNGYGVPGISNSKQKETKEAASALSRSTGLLQNAPKFITGVRPTDEVVLGAVAREVAERVLRTRESADSDTCTVRYSDGMSLSHPKAYLQTRGHDLLDAAIEAYPQLQQCTKGRDSDQVLFKIVEMVMPQFPSLIPGVFVDLFRELHREASPGIPARHPTSG